MCTRSSSWPARTNVRHCERARANEIIVGAEFSSRLISSATLDHGITRVISEILSAQYGNDLITVSAPTSLLLDHPFLDVVLRDEARPGDDRPGHPSGTEATRS